MISVRIDWTSAAGDSRKRVKLYELLGSFEVRPNKVKEEGKMFFVIIEEKYMEKLIANATKEAFRRHNFEIFNPLEYNALRTIIVKQIDPIMDHYEDDQIKRDIESANQWIKIEHLIKLPTTSKMLKLRLATSEMALKATKDGLYVLNQSIPARNIEKEIFVRLKPCTNCYAYDHLTRNCTKEQKTMCTFCAREGHKQSRCTETIPHCINCGEEHRTLASSCPKRKQLIKERSKNIRERSRSRTQTRTYAGAARQPNPNIPQPAAHPTPSMGVGGATKDLITTLLASITYAHFKNTLKPGTFQATMTAMLQANGLPNVIFPVEDLNKDVESVLEDLVQETRAKQTYMETNDGATAMDQQQEEYEKRKRDETTPPMETQRRKRWVEDRQEETTVYRISPSAPPSSPESRGSVRSMKDKFEPMNGPPPPQQPQPQSQPQSQPLGPPRVHLQTGTKAKPQEQRQRALSLTRSGMTIKSIKLTCYLQKEPGLSSAILNDPTDIALKQYAKEKVLRGEAKVTWNEQRISKESIKKMFEMGERKNLNEVVYVLVDNIETDIADNNSQRWP